MGISIWEMTILLTFAFVLLSLTLQLFMKRGQDIDHDKFAEILEQNKLLFKQLDDLKTQVFDLNKELTMLTEENKVLNGEVSSLTREVSRLHNQVNNIK